MSAAYLAFRRISGPDGEAETLVLKDGPCWTAGLIGPFWALARRRWRAAAALGCGWAFAGAFATFSGPEAASAIWLIVAIWSTWNARNFEFLTLDRQGWRLHDIAYARNREIAEAEMIRRETQASGAVEKRWDMP